MKLGLVNKPNPEYEIKIEEGVFYLSLKKYTTVNYRDRFYFKNKISINIPLGFLLLIDTHQELLSKSGILFPAQSFIRGNSEIQDFTLALENTTRDPIVIPPGTLIGFGVCIRQEPVEMEEISMTKEQLPTVYKKTNSKAVVSTITKG